MIATAAPLALAAAILLTGCATTASPRTVDSESRSKGAGKGSQATGKIQDGRASYYGRMFDGRRTASGERYDPERLTAAHATLPFGTWIRVTRVGGASVEVRVNDRCGCGGGRIVDLSRAAARRLDMIRAGVVPVRVQVIDKK